MKTAFYFMFVFFLSINLLYSQNKNENQNKTKNYNCKSLIKTTIDKMTGDTTTASKEYLIVSDDGVNGFAILVFKSSDNITMLVIAFGGGNCIDDGDGSIILFRDGSRMSISNYIGFNCDAEFIIVLTKGGNLMNALKTKDIETMRIITSNSLVQEDFSLKQSKKLLKIMNCISE